jgi:glycerol-3-phosphate dehydrogenase
MSSELPIMTPCYKWWEVPYYWAGMKAYDMVAGTRALHWSHYLTPSAAKSRFPTLCSHRKEDGNTLKGAIVYSDGQFNDARLAIIVACSAALAGATVINHAPATKLIKDPSSGKVIGATVTDKLTGKSRNVYAKVIVNAGGPFCDQIRHLGDPNAPPMITPSAGVHITLPDYYSPEAVGMIVPKTKDGRVVFMLPWLEQTIAGTTDSESRVTMTPQPTEAEIQFILDAISDYLTVKVRRSDVQSAWSGIRPLALDPNAKDTASASRDHIVTVDRPSGLITVTGGKWTTYRLMAEDCINKAVSEGNLDKAAGPCITEKLPLLGAHTYWPALFTEVAQNYTVPHRPGAIDTRVAKYLVASYGDRAAEITKIAEDRGLGRRLVRGYPVIEAEVVYAMKNEYCETPEDFLARRTRLAFLDRLACRQALPKVVEIMGGERGWGRWRKKVEEERARVFLETFEAPGVAYPGPPQQSK